MSSSSPSPEIDEEALYGVFLNSQRWREKLSRRATHKALDLADEDMNISVQKGMTWRELLILGLMCPAGLGVLLATHQFLAASPATQPHITAISSTYHGDLFPVRVRHLIREEIAVICGCYWHEPSSRSAKSAHRCGRASVAT